MTPLLGALADTAGWDALWLATALTAAFGAFLAFRLPPVPVPTEGSRP